MGYFDALAAASFKTDAVGRHLFFPWGAFGRGYAIPTEEAYLNTRKALTRMQQVAFPAVIVLAAVKPWAPVVALVAYSLVHAIWVQRTVAGWERSQERLSLLEAYDNQARHMNRRLIWSLLGLSLVFTVMGVFTVVVEPRLRPITAPGVVLTGLAALAFTRMLRVSRGAGAK